MWSALACCGWSAIAVQTVALEWTPDCGGVSFGAPFPFATSWMASSQEFDLYVGPLLVDLLVYAIILAAPTGFLFRLVLGLSGWMRRAALSTLGEQRGWARGEPRVIRHREMRRRDGAGD
jgi:hypothetical protein